MPGLNSTIKIEYERRLCTVNGRLGYFHTWEHFSQPLPASPMVGGQPAGVSSNVLGIVEFPEGVERVYPTSIKFCDGENANLAIMQKAMEDKGNNG